MKSKKINFVIIIVALAVVLVVFFYINQSTTSRKNNNKTKINQTNSDRKIIINDFISKNLGKEWKLEGVIKSPSSNEIIFSVSRFNFYSKAETKIYKYDNTKNESPILINESGNIDYVWIPELWQANDIIEVAKISTEMEHPYDIFKINLQGDIVSEPKFMYLSRVFTPDHRYFLYAEPGINSPYLHLFLWAPQNGFNRLVWEDVVNNKVLTIQEQKNKHYSTVGISDNGNIIIYKEFTVKSGETSDEQLLGPILIVKNIESETTNSFNTIEAMQEFVNKNYPNMHFTFAPNLNFRYALDVLEPASTEL